MFRCWKNDSIWWKDGVGLGLKEWEALNWLAKSI